AIAKRIEAGREAMIAGLCESPLTFQAIILWREELNEGRIFLRDIIDLEATYAGPDAKNFQPPQIDPATGLPIPQQQGGGLGQPGAQNGVLGGAPQQNGAFGQPHLRVVPNTPPAQPAQSA